MAETLIDRARVDLCVALGMNPDTTTFIPVNRALATGEEQPLHSGRLVMLDSGLAEFILSSKPGPGESDRIAAALERIAVALEAQGGSLSFQFAGTTLSDLGV